MQRFVNKHSLVMSMINTQNLRRIVLKQKEEIEKLWLGIDLEFFHVDNECTGVGASTFSDRDKFPLIHDSELYD